MSLARFPGISLQCDEHASRADWSRRNEDTKRQRTTSGSASSISQSKSCRREADSENEIEKPEKTKNVRGAAARNHRNKEVRDHEAHREKERVDTLGGRKGRAERRRGDGIFPHSSASLWTLLKFAPLRVGHFAPTTLTDRVLQGRHHEQCPLRSPCPSRSPTAQDRTKKDWTTTGEARSCWKESVH